MRGVKAKRLRRKAKLLHAIWEGHPESQGVTVRDTYRALKRAEKRK